MLEDHVNTVSKHDCGIPNIDNNIGSTLPKVLDLSSGHRCMDNIMNFLALYLNGDVLVVVTCISCSTFPWEGYTPNSGV